MWQDPMVQWLSERAVRENYEPIISSWHVNTWNTLLFETQEGRSREQLKGKKWETYGLVSHSAKRYQPVVWMVSSISIFFFPSTIYIQLFSSCCTVIKPPHPHILPSLHPIVLPCFKHLISPPPTIWQTLLHTHTHAHTHQGLQKGFIVTLGGMPCRSNRIQLFCSEN